MIGETHPLQICGKPRGPEMPHPHGMGGGWVGPHPQAQPRTQKQKGGTFFASGAFGATHPKMSYPPGGGRGVWHKALVVGSVSLWQCLLASRP